MWHLLMPKTIQKSMFLLVIINLEKHKTKKIPFKKYKWYIGIHIGRKE